MPRKPTFGHLIAYKETIASIKRTAAAIMLMAPSTLEIRDFGVYHNLLLTEAVEMYHVVFTLSSLVIQLLKKFDEVEHTR